MTRFRFVVVILGLTILSACADDRGGPMPSDPAGALDPAGWASDLCPDREIRKRIASLFPLENDLRKRAFEHCGNALEAFEAGAHLAAGWWGHRFLWYTTRLYDRSRLLEPEEETTEGAIALLFADLFERIQTEGPPLTAEGIAGGGLAIELVTPDRGRLMVTPNRHAAVRFWEDYVSDRTWAVVIQLPAPQEPTTCPDGFPGGLPCYPLFFDYSLFPESHLQGEPRVSLCVVDEGPFAPPEEALDDLRLASPTHDQPDELMVWPVANASTALDCADASVALFGEERFGDHLWDALGPFHRLFRVTPAYANPGRLGASVSTFSPFAAVDPR